MTDNYTHESIRLKANEAMLSAKGFELFVVTSDGELITIGDNTALTAAERRGLTSWRRDCDNEGSYEIK